MTRYLFQTQYRGATLTDNIGEEFVTLREAEAHATVVAKELGRNRADDQAITVFVLSKDGELLARSSAEREDLRCRVISAGRRLQTSRSAPHPQASRPRTPE